MTATSNSRAAIQRCLVSSSRNVTILAFIAALFAACQAEGPPALSLEEAKQATTSIDVPSFAAPPKTINDVTALLDAEKPDPAKLAAARAKAAAPTPGLTGDALALALLERGNNREAVGDLLGALADYRTAANVAKDPIVMVNALDDLGVAELLVGEFEAAIAHFRQGIASTPTRVRGRLLVYYGRLSIVLAGAGDLRGAEDALNRMYPLRDSLEGTPVWARSGGVYAMRLKLAEARALDAKGQYAEAEPKHRSAIRDLDEGVMTNFRTGILTSVSRAELSTNLLRQDRLAESEVEIRRALSDTLARVGKYSGETSRILLYFINVLNGQGRYADAEKLARINVDIFRTIGARPDSFYVMESRQYLADSLAAQGKWAEAQAEFRVIAMADSPDSAAFRRALAANVNPALAALHQGDAPEGLRLARRVVEYNAGRKGSNHYDTAESRGVLAMALAATGDRAAARRAYDAAVPILLQRSRRSDAERATPAERDRRLKLILDSYIALLAESGDAADAARAFEIADAARGQSVQRALSASTARAAANDPALADLARREQDALKQIGALNGLLSNAVSVPTDQQNRTAINDLRVRIDTLRAARAALAEELERRFPDYAALINPKPAAIADAQAWLRDGEALVATYVGADRTFVWAVPKTGAPTFAAVPLGRGRIAAAVADLRRALDPRVTRLGDIPAFDIRLANRLYGTLLEPVKSGWKDAGSIFVVAHGALGQLPFSVLLTEPVRLPDERPPLFSNYRHLPWLVRDHAVTVLPSVASLIALRRLPAASPTRRSFAGFGDPVFGKARQSAGARSSAGGAATLASRGLLAVRGLPVSLRAAPRVDGLASADLAKLPRLPDTADEVRSIAIALHADLTRDVFTGARASEARLRSMNLSAYRVLAFATHGLVPGDLDGLTQPALALSAPETGSAEDGLLTMGEILGLKLDADWVVLSACNTAAGRGSGAEAVSGLGRAFFYAGTRALLVSNWPVETTSANMLTTDLFRRQAAEPTLGRAEALRRSMLALIDGPGLADAQGRTVFSYAHPIFWAPFSLVGDGG